MKTVNTSEEERGEQTRLLQERHSREGDQPMPLDTLIADLQLRVEALERDA